MLDRLFNFLTASPTFQFLRNVVPFDFLGDEELQRVADALFIEYHPKGTTLFIEGQSDLEGLLVVQKGVLALSRRGGEHENGKRFVEAGGHFGGTSILRNAGIALYTVKAVEDTFVYVLAKKYFLDVCSRHIEFSDYFQNILGADSSAKLAAVLQRRWLAPSATAKTSFLERTLGDLLASVRTPICMAEERMGDVARMLVESELAYALIHDAKSDDYSILSLADLVSRAYLERGSLDDSVGSVVREKPLILPAEIRLIEVLERLGKSPQGYIGTRNVEGKVFAVARVEDVLAARSHSPIEFLRDLWRISLRKDLENKQRELGALVRTMLWEGTSVDGITSIVALVSDTILARIVEFAEQEMGMPPCPYAVIVLGSEGRREQTLVTDQDNAIVFSDVDEHDLPAVQDYFLKLGERICSWLNQAGYPFCVGGNMASNPFWCKPLSVWKNYFRNWIQTPEPDAVLNSAIWFDFRLGFGSGELVEELRSSLLAMLKGRPPLFFYHLTSAALQRRPPLGFFKGLVLEERDGRRDSLDLKLPASCLSDFARVHALFHGIIDTNTLERLAALRALGVIDVTTFNDLQQAYTLLTRLRFMAQVQDEGGASHHTSNLIGVEQVSPLERRFLEEVFRLIERLQGRLREQFMGRTMG